MLRTSTTGKRLLRSVPAVIGVAALSAAGIAAGAQASPAAAASVMAPCAAPTSPTPPSVTPTTVDVVGQIYSCVLANYYSGPVQDDRPLLTAAFAGLVQELDRSGIDQPSATMPALTGDRSADWIAFSAVLRQVFSRLPADAAVRQAVAEATVAGMLSALHDNHVHWFHPDGPVPPGGPATRFGLGFQTDPANPLMATAPAEALGPLSVAKMDGGPATAAGLKPGDVIEAVDDAPPFVAGVVSAGVQKLLDPHYPDATPVTLRLHRPSTGRTWTVTLTPSVYQPISTTQYTAKLLPGNIAYVEFDGFVPGIAGQVLKAITALGQGRTLHGLVLDLRGNGGGSTFEMQRLLGGFEHGTPYAFDCDVSGHCDPQLPDATVPLLRLPLVVLTDRNCASACDAFSGAVKDLGLGTLIGERTSGIVSGSAGGFVLADGSFLMMPTRHEVGARHEMINGIGVAPDYVIPLTAEDVSMGRDPELAEALRRLR